MDQLVKLKSVADILALEEPWRSLAGRATRYSMAQTFDYGLTALEQALSDGNEAYLILLRDGEALTGIWGLTLSRRSLHRTLEPFSCGAHEEFSGPLLQVDNAIDLAERALRLAVSIGADRLLLYNIEPNGPLDVACGKLGLPNKPNEVAGFVVSSEKFPTWESAEKVVSREIRSSLRRYARRLEELEPPRKLRIGWRQTPEESDRGIDFFMKQKRLWAERNRARSPWLHRDAVSSFFKRLSRRVDLSQFPVVATVALGDTPIAAALCLNTTHSVEYCFTAYDENYAKYGPGKLLLRFLIEWSLTKGRDFDFGITIAKYKEEWPVEKRVYVSRRLYLSARGRLSTLGEVKSATRMRLVSLRDRLCRAS